MSTEEISNESALTATNNNNNNIQNVNSTSTNNFDLMLLQLCFDVSEFDDLIDDEDEEEEQQNQQLEKRTTSTTSSSLLAFDPFSFVASRQQHVSLEQLEADLQKYAAHLNQAMLTCVHDEVYESFTHVAAQLGSTSKKLATVKAPLSHYLERIKSSSASVEKARREIDKSLQEATTSEMERRFYAARVEAALIARNLNQFLTSPSASAVVSSSASLSPSNTNNNSNINNSIATKNASLSRKSLNQELSSSATMQSQQKSDANNGDQENDREQADHQVITSALINLLEQLPSACQSLRRLNQLVTEMQVCVSYISEVSTTIETQTNEISSFVDSCSILEKSLVALLCSAFDVCYFPTSSSSSGVGSSNAIPANSFLIPEMKRICELFCSMDLVPSFVEYFKDSIVRPLVEDVISWRAASQARQSPEEAAKLLSTLKSVLSESGPLSLISILQQALTGGSQPTSNLDEMNDNNNNNNKSLLIIASWSATADTIMKRALFLFNPGMPSHYHKHFAAANELLALHEQKCLSSFELCSLRLSAEVALWVRKWNVDVYHALRQKELNDFLDGEVFKPSDDKLFAVAPKSDPQNQNQQQIQQQLLFATSTVSEVFEKMKSLINPRGEIFLFSLQHKFLRDLVSTISKLITTAKSFLNERASSSASLDISSLVQLWSRIDLDFEHLAREIRTQFPPLIEQGFAGAWSDANTAIVSAKDFTSLIVDEIYSAKSGLTSVIKSSVIKQCMSNLGNVRSVKTAFSMTKKSVPTEPSTYLKGALQPLVGFYDALKKNSNNNNNSNSGSATNSLMAEISTELLNEFAEIVKEIVISSRKAQESLEKLRRARAAANNNNNNNNNKSEENNNNMNNNVAAAKDNTKKEVTDRDKIVVQLYLDINELVNMMRKFGINAESFAPFKNLFSFVKRALWVLSNFEGDEPEEIEE